MILLRLAWRNLWRYRRRTQLTAGAMALGLAFSLIMGSIIGGSYAQVFDTIVTEGLGHAQIHHPAYPGKRSLWDTIDGADTLATELRAQSMVAEVSLRLFGYALLGVEEDVVGAQLLGVEPASEARLTGVAQRIIAGRYLSDHAAREVVLGEGLAKRLGATPGAAIVAVTQAADGSVGNALYTVIGVVRTGSVARDRSAALMHIDDLRELLVLPNSAHEVALTTTDREAVAPMVLAVAPIAERHALLMRSWDQVDPQLAAMIGVGEGVGTILLGFVFGLAALGILNTMLMSVFERTHEFGLLIALGLKPRQIVMMVAAEAVSLAVVAAAVGLPLGLSAVAWLVLYGIDLTAWTGRYSVAGITYDRYIFGTFRPDEITRAAVGLLIISLIAALWPALRAARLQPIDAMREM